MPGFPLRSKERSSTGARAALLIAIAATLAIYVLPFGHTIGYPLILLSTVAHEMGHGFAGILVGGHFDSIVIHSDAGGYAQISGYDGRLARAFVSAGGLCGPACAAAIAFFIARSARLSRVALIVSGAFLAVSLVWVVRNLFGWMVVGGAAVVIAGVGLRARPETARAFLVFVAVQLALTVFSRGDYLFTETADLQDGPKPSDVANMASSLFLPYWFWGALCGAFSIAVLAWGVRSYMNAALPAAARAPRNRK
jgi:peptidase M50B-like protein